MNHVNLNTVSDEVRQFILSFRANGTVFELDGQPVACMVPPPIPANGAEEWTDAKNARRCYLIDKEIAGSITGEEAKELEDLTWQMRRYVNKVAPLPLAATRKLHQELLAKAAKAQGGTSDP